jgi:hypothetical protein
MSYLQSILVAIQDDGRKQHTDILNMRTCSQEIISIRKGKHPTFLQQETNHESLSYCRRAEN